MDFADYLFAVFVFLLFVALISIYVKLTGPLRKNDSTTVEKERRLFKLYQNLEEMMDSIESYVEEAKKEIAVEREEITALVEKALLLSQQRDVPAAASVQVESTMQKEELSLEAERIKKYEKVAVLKGKGMNIEQIAQELEISCGEVLLILSIIKK